MTVLRNTHPAREIMASYYILKPQSTTKLVNNIIKLNPETYLLINQKNK